MTCHPIHPPESAPEATVIIYKIHGNSYVYDDAQNHYYQPMWTLVGAGAKTLADSCRQMASLIPPQAAWIKDAVSEFHPEENYIVTTEGKKIGYDYLVVALGLQVNFNKVHNNN